MNTNEGLMKRWLRLKRYSAVGRRQGGPANGRLADGEDGTQGSSNSVVAFDIASLPSIQTIVAGGDVRPFLQSGVPEDLTRVALRSAWNADPAIRNHIGIAENQWDFNDPASIPGFGVLGNGDVVQRLVDHVLAGLDRGAVNDADRPSMTTMPAAIDPGLREVDHMDKVWLSAVGRTTREAQAEIHNAVYVGLPPDGRRRAHGTALPR